MKRSMILTAIVLALFAPAAAQEPSVDEVGEQASKLEAELGKYKDTSPEAAETLVKLVDLYHADGRVFGLIRAAETFTAAAPADPRHRAVMLKLIDGLEATSRNQEMVATGRQFLARYPGAPECAPLEVRLADTLVRMGDYAGAAGACRLVWNRQSNSPTGRRYGAMAVDQYARAGGTENITAAAELAEAMLDKSPSGDFAKWIGYRAFNEWRRISQFAPSNVVGNKLLKKGIAADKELAFELHCLMVDNYERLGQHANAAEAARRARGVRDTGEWHRRQIERLHSALAEPRQIEPVVADYLRKYPNREDRYRMQGMLALAYLRSGDKPRGLNLLAEVIKHEAEWGGFAQTFVQEKGADPEQFGAIEGALRNAINANPRQACYLRHVLGFKVYRDLMKDDGKARPVFRDLIVRSPSDRHTREVVEWLLDNAPTDNEFRAEVARIIASRKENLQLGDYHKFLGDWQQKAKQRDADFKAKARYVQDELKKADGDPIVGVWLKAYDQDPKPKAPGRATLLEPNTFGKLNNGMARAAAWRQAEYLYRSAPAQERVDSVEVLARVCQRFRTDYPLVERYLQLATDYGTPEQCKAAAQHMLRFEPEPNGSDVWRLLLTAAEKNEDANLAKQAYAWIMKARQQHGGDPGLASAIGEILERFGMEKEALEYWTTYVSHDRRNGESKNCAERLRERLEGAERARLAAELARHDTDYHGGYAQWAADDYRMAGDLNNFEKVLRDVRQRQDQRPLRNWDYNNDVARSWVDAYRADTEASEADRLRVYRVVRDLGPNEASALARLALLEIDAAEAKSPIERLLACQETTRLVRNDGNGWNRLMPYAQAALGRKDYQAAATLLTGMLANVPNVDGKTKQAARDMVALCYGRMGAVGLTIDESSPIAPLLKAALSLRLGDERLAFDTYLANRQLFDEHRTEAPVDLVIFVCEKLVAAGGDENHDRVEETLRGWLVKHSESEQFDDAAKARVGLLLARNYFNAQRYDVARS